MLPILFRDEQYVVLDKPAGLAVHPGPRGGPSVEDWFPVLFPTEGWAVARAPAGRRHQRLPCRGAAALCIAGCAGGIRGGASAQDLLGDRARLPQGKVRPGGRAAAAPEHPRGVADCDRSCRAGGCHGMVATSCDLTLGGIAFSNPLLIAPLLGIAVSMTSLSLPKAVAITSI